MVKSTKIKANQTADAPQISLADRLRSLNHDLLERYKELNCLYGISRLVEKKNITLDELLQGVVDLVPPAWQYPDVTAARIKLSNREYTTANFRRTAWRQEELITVNGRQVGRLEVYYLADRPPVFEGPFLKEERDLIHGIAERLGHIIESRKAENALHKMYTREKSLRQKLQNEMQNRVVFTRQLIHELKTPLTSLLPSSQLLLEETKGTRLEKLAGYVWEGANGLNSRIDELHDVVRGEIGKLKLDVKSVDLEQLLKDLLEETRAQAKAEGMSMTLSIVSPLPRVSADPARVRQIMLNLINNAYKYAAEGKKIEILARLDPASRTVEVEVRDHGPGIPRVKWQSLFKPAYRKIGNSTAAGGLGIGLPLCKTLVTLHGGKMWIGSAPRGGASVFFTLCVAADKIAAPGKGRKKAASLSGGSLL